jgi:ribulose kinase
MHIYADVTGQSIYTTRIAEASLLGSAVVAAVGAGLYPTLQESSQNMVKLAESFQPDYTRHLQYQFYVQKYQEIYQHIQGVMRDVSRHTSA